MNEALATLAEEYWEHVLRTSPTQALMLGDHRYDDQIEDLSRQAEDDEIAAMDGFAAAARAIEGASLTADERVTREVLLFEATNEADELRSRMAEFAVDPGLGLHAVWLQLVGQLPLTAPEHAEAVVSKFEKLETLFTQAAQRLRQGVARGRTPPRTSVEKVVGHIDAYLASPIDTDPFVTIPAPATMDETSEVAWRDRLRDVVATNVRPGYLFYRTVLADEVLDRSRPPERSGVRWLEDGEQVYARAIRKHTSLSMAPLQIHEIGLEMIAELATEYRELGGAVLGTRDLNEIFSRLRDDTALRFTSSDEITAAAEGAMARAQAAIPQWFGRLPVAVCVLRQIPGPGAELSPLAYYLPPAADGSRPGTFFVNTTEPETRTRYESEALAFHESIPGHHLQLAIAQELDGVPKFRKHGSITAYSEGWGLYTERLSDEMGLYSSPLDRVGMLAADSMRAGRLVVDTGIHALGWSRGEAIQFMLDNSPMTERTIEDEVDRYISWPGQALAYMIGRLEIDRIRADAEARLGDRFDIKGFHDVVLGSGLVPLTTLDRIVRDWSS